MYEIVYDYQMYLILCIQYVGNNIAKIDLQKSVLWTYQPHQEKWKWKFPKLRLLVDIK